MYNFGLRLGGSLDGYPLPPSDLVDLVIGTRELAWYQLGGLFMHQAIGTFLRRNGRPIESFKAILDFGCGCGRIIRWWADLQAVAEIWGSDYNPDLVAWCQKELSKFANYKVNQADPPLPFEDEKFDLVYSYSVFTHLSTVRQVPWMKDLIRVLKPGGMLLITVHGERAAWRAGFSPEQLHQLEDRGIIVFGEERSGENACASYVSESFIRSHQSLGVQLIDFLAGGVRDASEQDMALYYKPGP